MAIEGTYEPSLWPPVADQVRQYEESAGTEGTLLEGQPCVILWTRGRHSGNVRKSPLMRVNDGDRYAVVASMGGAPKWWPRATAVWPAYDDYQASTDRDIPVVVLDPA